MEPESHENKHVSELIPTEDTPLGWFNLGCSLATKGQLVAAEKALKIALDMQKDYAIAWIILSVVLLSQGHETDAEKAGKMVLEQCADLKMTWPKLRSIMFSQAIQRGKDWKSPKRVRIETSDTSEWGIVLSRLNESSYELLRKFVTEDEEQQASEPSAITEGMDEIDKSKDVSALIAPESLTSTLKDQQAETHTAEYLFSMARAHMNKREFDSAEEAFMRGLTLDPENGEALLRVGTLLMRKEDYDKAEDSFRLAVKYSPENSEAWLQLGICLQAVERWQESSDVLKIASEKNPQNAEIWVKLGEADYYRSRYQEAAKSFLRALRIHPNHEFGLFYLGRCMEYRGNSNHALRVYRKLLNLRPENPEILEEISKSFHRLGEIQSANRAKSLAASHRKSKTGQE